MTSFVDRATERFATDGVLKFNRIADIEAFEGEPCYDIDTGEPLNRVWHERVHNVITTLGLNWVADHLSGQSPTDPTGMEIGDSGTAASLGDTDVITALSSSDSFQPFESAYPIDNGTSVVWRSIWTDAEVVDADIQEVVIKSTASSTDAISRIVFTAVDKSGANLTLTITVTWTLAEG